MEDFLGNIGQAVYMAFGMLWQVFWSLILGLTISAIIQTQVPKTKIRQALGNDGPKEIALATFLGAISSSCSYAAVSASKSFFKKGAGLVPSLAFLFSSTNLVIELGLLLWLLLGWQFALAEWLGGILLIIIMSILVKLTATKKLVSQARSFKDQVTLEHDHQANGPDKLQAIARAFSSEASMLKKDLALGFIIAGFIATFIPSDFWANLFATGSTEWGELLVGAIIGTIIAVLSFVCSIGNVPLAAILWTRGLSFSGVLAFLYADLIVIPLLDLYRRYFGWKMASYIGIIFFLTIVITGSLVAFIFTSLKLTPLPVTGLSSQLVSFNLNYTFWLNIVFGGLAIYWIYLSKKAPTEHSHHH